MLYKNPYGEQFSWVYNNYSPDLKKFVVDIQWLQWQGREFRIICNSQSEMIGMLTQLADAIDSKVETYYCSHGHKNWNFTTDRYSFCPSDVKSICGEFSEILLTPASLKSRDALEKDIQKIKNMIYVTWET